MKLLILAFVSLFTQRILASSELESLGTFHFQEFVLAPALALQEPGLGGFEINDSWLSVQWVKDANTMGEMRLGSLDPSQFVVWMTPNPNNSHGVGLLEAWIETATELGRWRVGRLPVSDGFEGTFGNGFWLMPASEVKKHGWIFTRDLGLSYSAESNPWFMEMTVHNGEGENNTDGRMFVTGRWQYLNNASGDGVLLTGTEGNTTAMSTLGSLAQSRDQFVIAVDQPAKIRYGTLSFFHLWKRNYWNFEISHGEILQSTAVHPFAWGRGDLSWNVKGDLNLLVRFEQTQADLHSSDSIRQTLGAGFLLSSRDQLSSLTLFASHHQENPAVPNDEILLQFRLNSTSLGH